MNLKIKIASALLIIGINCFGQAESAKLVDNYLKTSVKKQSTSELLKKILASDQASMVFAINPYLSDSSVGIRIEAYSLLTKIGMKCPQDETRNKVVKLLIKGCRDKNSGICGSIINNLCQFSKKDFDQEAAYDLSMLTKEKIPFYHKLIKLIGFVDISDMMPEFKKMIGEKRYPNNQVLWALHLALARMGDINEIDFCVRKVRSLPVNDDVVYDIVPDLVYTHQKKAFEYLFEIIESDKKDCNSSNPDSNAKIICAYRVMGQIASSIANFPVETYGSGDLKTKDYPATLVKVREWIKANRDTYTIKNDTF